MAETNTDNNEPTATGSESTEYHPLIIVGGGIGGLVLALCLDQAYNRDNNDNPQIKLPIHIYESTTAYKSDAGGAIGLYANGLRVLRNLSSHEHSPTPELLSQVREAGCDYIYRRWMRHDGTEVAVAREDELLPGEYNNGNDGDDDDDGAFGTAASLAPEGMEDPEGERANRRPRGGSFNGVRTLTKMISGRLLNVVDRVAPASPPGSPNEESDQKDDAKKTDDAKTEDVTAANVSASDTPGIETELLSIGIRRWKYQDVLYQACVKAGIHFHFGKRLQSVTSYSLDENCDAYPLTCLHFKDGSKVTTSLVIGADGINSKVRNYVTNPIPKPDGEEEKEFVPEYTGVTCLMGCANVPRIRGICFPSSATTKCHACYYPTRVPKEGSANAENNNNSDANDTTASNKEKTNTALQDNPSYEQVFQIYFPSPIERPDTWRTLTPEEAKEECRDLAKKLREDGWDEQFLAPLESETLTGVLRVGLRSREALDCWHVGSNEGKTSNDEEGTLVGRAVLLGDAAHPPVPYIGQGAMMAMEDAGTLAMLLGRFCPLEDKEGGEEAKPDFRNFAKAMETYESLRVARTKMILGSSVALGKTQQRRAESKLYNAWREWSIKAQVWAYGTLPVMRPGAAFDYKAKVEEVLAESKDGE